MSRLLLVFSLLWSLIVSGNSFAEDIAPSTAESALPQSVNATLAQLSDEQVRQMLITELQKDATLDEDDFSFQDRLQGPSAPLASMLNSLDGQSVQSIDTLKQLLKNTPRLLPDLSQVFVTLCPFGTHQGAVVNLFWVAVFIAIGFSIEFLGKKFVVSRYFNTSTEKLVATNHGHRFLASVIIIIPETIGVVLFFLAAYLSFLLFDTSDSPFVRLTFIAVVITVVLIRCFSIVSSVMLSPQIAGFRILPLECPAAKAIHRLMLFSFGYIVTALMFVVVLHKLGASRETILLLQLFFATFLLLLTAVFVLSVKNRVRQYIVGVNDETTELRWGVQQFASIWHFLALLYIGVLWALLLNSISVQGPATKDAFILSFFVLPIWMIADKITQWIVHYTMSTLKLHEEHYQDREEPTEEVLQIRENGRNVYLKVRLAARLSLVVVLCIWIAGLWNIHFPFISNLASVAIDTLIIVTIAMFFWRMVSTWIESKIAESTPEEEEESSDGEWGAVARGRSYTLLPMIRKFVATVLVIMVTMTILSSVGVDIGPLLAGAGVVGLAVGFGAQKLVADMFSGFFYLLDDAFRVGEYLEASAVSGTVESITLRNVMLRHHRGMLQIVPHSELGPITNFMRGGIIVKFNLDFNYNANIDKIRKIIKKVGIAMLEDEEFGADFIQPVKSQGVREITNSVMTIRVKFTAKPGTHFVIRREAYRRITESLKQNGIEYAMRQVVVDVPGLADRSTELNLKPSEVKHIVDAAGGAARILEEQPATGVSKDNLPSR